MNAKNKRVLTVIRCSSERMVENMHKSKYIAMIAAAAMALTLAGCGGKGGELIERRRSLFICQTVFRVISVNSI